MDVGPVWSLVDTFKVPVTKIPEPNEIGCSIGKMHSSPLNCAIQVGPEIDLWLLILCASIQFFVDSTRTQSRSVGHEISSGSVVFTHTLMVRLHIEEFSALCGTTLR